MRVQTHCTLSTVCGFPGSIASKLQKVLSTVKAKQPALYAHLIVFIWLRVKVSSLAVTAQRKFWATKIASASGKVTNVKAPRTHFFLAQRFEASLANELSTLEGERQRCHEYSRMHGSKAWKKPLETLNLKIISTENSLREIKFHINLFHGHVRGGAELCRRMAHQFGVPQHLMFQ
jgi:hypothetical protein